MEKRHAKWGFLRELKRRRVLHTASLYVLGSWIALQVVEVLSGAGLPPSTMRNLLIGLSFGFPLALVAGWFFDISIEGIEKTGPLKLDEQLPKLKFIDHVLLVGLLLVVVMDAYILSFPPPEDVLVVNTPASQHRTIAVLGFEDLELADGSTPIGDVFAGELRSSLTRTAGLRVLGPETSKMLRLAGDNRLVTAKELLVTALVLGEVLLEGGRIRVNARLIGIPAGNEIWSTRVEAPAGEAIELQQGLLGFVKASAAARRALELNDTLPEAWAVLAEIAEEEARWTDSEEYFLRALYADPTNAHVNGLYSEALIARGRVTEALRYALDAYRFEPASLIVNWRAAIAAIYAGDADLTIKHAEIVMDIRGSRSAFLLDLLAEGYLLKGETDLALSAYTETGQRPDWFLDCVRVRDDPGLAADLIDSIRETLNQHKTGQLEDKKRFWWTWSLIRCGAWIGEPDVVFDVLFAEGLPPFEEGLPTELIFINMFHPDGTVLRQDPRFRELVVESGLLDYWRQWGWSDFCEPDGDSFRCN
jgi:TolB-like protein